MAVFSFFSFQKGECTMPSIAETRVQKIEPPISEADFPTRDDYIHALAWSGMHCIKWDEGMDWLAKRDAARLAKSWGICIDGWYPGKQ